MLKRLLIGLLSLECLVAPVWAYRTEEPSPISKWDCPSFSRLNHYLHELWNITNGRYNLDTLTASPNGVRQGTRGELVYAAYGGDQYICVNSSTAAQGTTWTCVNIVTFGTICGGSSATTEILFNNAGACDGDEGLTFTPATNLVNINEATDGDSILLRLDNDQANAAASTNETAQVRFGFGTDTDVGRITVGKAGDFTTTNDSDGILAFAIDNNNSMTEMLRMVRTGVGIFRTTNTPNEELEVFGSIGAFTSATTDVPDAMGTGQIWAQTGIAVGSDSDPSNDLAHLLLRQETGSTSMVIMMDSTLAAAGSRIEFQTASAESARVQYSTTETAASTFANAKYLLLYERDETVTLGSNNENPLLVIGDPDATRTLTIADSNTIANQRWTYFDAPTIDGVAGGGTETCTNCATVYIQNAPSGSNITITNPYALWVDDGAVRFDGTVTYNSTALFVDGTEVTGQLVTFGTDPTLSACGSSPSINGGDTAGKITIGGGGAVTSCTATFAEASVNAPACVVSGDNTAVTYQATTTTSAMTISSSADMQSDVLSYICVRYLP